MINRIIVEFYLLYRSLTSSTVFGSEGEGATTLTRLGCYDQVGVCVFCAQFFYLQEEYRPSFSDIVRQEKKAEYFDNRRREKEYWDPLKMMEKEREVVSIFIIDINICVCMMYIYFV